MAADPLRKLVRLAMSEPRAIGELLEAQWFLVRARNARRHTATGDLFKASNPSSEFREEWEEPVQRVATAAARVSRFGLIRPTCLEQALAIQAMLKRRGIGPGVIRVGVQLHEGVFAAHAWVQLGDHVIGDTRARVSRFEPLADVNARDS